MRLPTRPLLLQRLLLALAPKRYRLRHGPSVLRLAAREMARGRRRSGALGAWGAWLASLTDTLATVSCLRAGALSGLLPKPESGAAMLTTLLREIVRAPRRLIRARSFSLPAVLSLSVGMGAATAALSLADAGFLRPLPYPESEELAVVMSTRHGEPISVSFPDFQDWEARTGLLEGLALYARAPRTMTGQGPARALQGLWVSSDLFSLLGVSPILGTGFDAADDDAGAEAKVVLTHRIWQESFGGDPEVLGTAVRLDGELFTVVGVMPPGFAFPDGAVLGASDLFLPAGLKRSDEDWGTRYSHPGIYAVARVAPGVELDAARQELNGVAAALAEEYPDSNENEGILMVGVRDLLVGDLGPSLVLLAVAGLLVLLVSSANVVGLFLARVTALGHDVAVRAALGAGRGRIALVFLAESLWLGMVAGALGAILAYLGFGLAASELDRFSLLSGVGVDARVLAGLVALVLATALAVGLVPALRSHGRSPALRQARGAVLGPRGERLQNGLVVAEIALAVALLSSATLLARSFVALSSEEGGIEAVGVAVFRLGLPELEYPEWEMTSAAYRDVEERLLALPGVKAVGAISTLPFTGAGSQSGMRPAGAVEIEPVRTDVNVVTPGYLDAMGVELVQGRGFLPSDDADAPKVVLVDTRFAERLWPGTSALGKRVDGWGLEGATVVGVVDHVRNYGVLRTSREELYMPHAQRPYLRMWMAARTSGDPAALAADVRSVVAQVDPDVPVETYRAMERIVGGTLGRPRLAAGLGLALALLAALLAVSGVYALVSFSVTRRRRELGVRMALGASAEELRAMVLRRVVRHTALGVAAGVVLAVAGRGFLEGLVYGASPGDPLSVALAGVVLVCASMAAGLVPALRAARMDPNRVLHQE